MVIALDEHGGTAGLLTTEDLSEEIVGEIKGGSRQPRRCGSTARDAYARPAPPGWMRSVSASGLALPGVPGQG
jgi:hypothetical protein